MGIVAAIAVDGAEDLGFGCADPGQDGRRNPAVCLVPKDGAIRLEPKIRCKEFHVSSVLPSSTKRNRTSYFSRMASCTLLKVFARNGKTSSSLKQGATMLTGVFSFLLSVLEPFMVIRAGPSGPGLEQDRQNC
jgi:hypothetical protein